MNLYLYENSHWARKIGLRTISALKVTNNKTKN